jgi:hypothetical protein
LLLLQKHLLLLLLLQKELLVLLRGKLVVELGEMHLLLSQQLGLLVLEEGLLLLQALGFLLSQSLLEAGIVLMVEGLLGLLLQLLQCVDLGIAALFQSGLLIFFLFR